MILVRGGGGGFLLTDIYPNPFNPQAQFTLTVAETQPVQIELFDVMGRSLGLLHQGELAAGAPRQFTIDGGGLPSGLYLLRAQGPYFSATRQVMLVK